MTLEFHSKAQDNPYLQKNKEKKQIQEEHLKDERSENK
jgi:hypothetical protein